MGVMHFTAIVFAGLVLLFAARESGHQIKSAIANFRREYRSRKLSALLTLFYLVAIGLRPVGHYAIEASNKIHGE